ncbi:MAG: glycine oxidase ThiO [Planctomycetia bacterium]|nr:glycine oxidase ThiO [Planctomycetia bacterium]
MADIVIIGGGVIGLSIAYEVAGQGASVQILERGSFGQEASWAGAGMIIPADPQRATTYEAQLRGESFVRWPAWSRQLFDETGIDNGFVNCGGIHLFPQTVTLPHLSVLSDLAGCARQLRADGAVVEELNADELRRLEPSINREIANGIYLPQMCQVRNPRHLKALIAACHARGVVMTSGAAVMSIERQGSRVTAAHTVTGAIRADQFVVCGGAWTQSILAAVGCSVEIEPVRGQIVLLEDLKKPLRRIIEVGVRYLVPRADGKILIGSTEEWTGFDKGNTAESVADLIRFATDLVPALKSARVDRFWSGLRPHAKRGSPYLGQVPETDNLFVAAGHFRSGLMLSPITGLLMRQLVLRQELVMPMPVVSCSKAAAT